MNLSRDPSYESNFSLNIQRVSKDTYLRIHDIDTGLVNSEKTDLKNEIKYKTILHKNIFF